MAGFKTFTSATLSSADVNGYLMKQAVIQCTSGTRPTGVQGMTIYQTDTNTMLTYTGATWSTIGPVSGALTAWTPTVDQGATTNIAKTSTNCWVSRVGRTIYVGGIITMNGAGSAGSIIIVQGLPVACSGAADTCIGTFVYKKSGTAYYHGGAMYNSSTSFFGLAHAQTTAIGAAPSFAVAATDVITFSLTYQATADA